jgi:hypothetical protein
MGRLDFRIVLRQQLHLLSILMSDRRRAVIWILALVAVVIGGDHLLAWGLQKILVRSQFRYSRLYRGGNSADVLILGDSRGVHSFYAPAIEELTGLRALNLSYNSMSPRIAEAILLDYLDRNRAPRMVIIEVTCVHVPGSLTSELRTYASLSPRLGALYAEQHPVAAAAGRVFRLFPLNSEFFLEALHYMRRSDQDWIYHDVMPALLRALRGGGWMINPRPANVDALARIVRVLRQRGIEPRLVIAPYGGEGGPVNLAPLAEMLGGRLGVGVSNYAGAITDLDDFADHVHLNERGSRVLLALMKRDGVFGMAEHPARF